MDRSIRAMCTDSITIHKFVSRNGALEPQYDAANPITLPCFISRKRKIIRSTEGHEVLSEATIILEATATAQGITVFDRVILPDLTSPLILSVRPCRGEKIVEHIEVNL